MHKGRDKEEAEQVKIAVRHTDRHEGFGVETGLRHANAVDSKNPHLIEDALNHPLGLICSRLVYVKVELCPSRGTFLLPLHEIT